MSDNIEAGVITWDTTATCKWCGEHVPVCGESTAIADISGDLENAMKEDGWKDGLCPDCASNERVWRAIKAEERAEHDLKCDREREAIEEMEAEEREADRARHGDNLQ